MYFTQLDSINMLQLILTRDCIGLCEVLKWEMVNWHSSWLCGVIPFNKKLAIKWLKIVIKLGYLEAKNLLTGFERDMEEEQCFDKE